MKKGILFALLISMLSCSSGRMKIVVPAMQRLEIDYPNYGMYRVKIYNRDLKELDISVENKKSGKKIRGFRMGAMSTEELQVEKENLLILENTSSNAVKLHLRIAENTSKVTVKLRTEYIDFTLQNTSDNSIPLIIPDVMNPNLSPQSNSGVKLRVGQEIRFRKGFRTYLFLKVSDEIKTGEVLDVAKLLEERKVELGLD
jgi:hypothetical protein